MSLLPIDIQANFGNLDLVVKEVNKIQNLSEQINYNGSITIEKFAKEIYEKIIETEESKEQQKIDDRKKEEQERKKQNQNEYITIQYEMTEDEMKRKLDLSKIEPYKGRYVNLYS